MTLYVCKNCAYEDRRPFRSCPKCGHEPTVYEATAWRDDLAAYAAKKAAVWPVSSAERTE